MFRQNNGDIIEMKVGDVCTVEVEITKPFRVVVWTFARILACDDDGMNWGIFSVQVIGEDFRREPLDGAVYRIDTDKTQRAASKLVEKQAGLLKAYPTLDAVRQAIVAKMALED